jgi:hypothetical protein
MKFSRIDSETEGARQRDDPLYRAFAVVDGHSMTNAGVFLWLVDSSGWMMTRIIGFRPRIVGAARSGDLIKS